jgi:hypothetical protein
LARVAGGACRNVVIQVRSSTGSGCAAMATGTAAATASSRVSDIIETPLEGGCFAGLSLHLRIRTNAQRVTGLWRLLSVS